MVQVLQRAAPSSGTGDENTQYDLPTISGLSVQIPLGHYTGAIVKGKFPPYSFIGGVPAKVIKSIKNNSSIDIEQKGFNL